MKSKAIILVRLVNSISLVALSTYLMSIPATALTGKNQNQEAVNYTNNQNLSEGDESLEINL